MNDTVRITTLTALITLGASLIPAQNTWELVWSDEFDAPAIDTGKWSWEVNATGGGNNELQFYTSRTENSYIQDGRLVIKAIKENYTAVDPTDGETKTRDYTSARLRTLNKGDWKYGRFEIRAKTPSGQGLWPAIWMLPTDWVYGGWAASGEIDIMEFRGDMPTTLFSTIHYGGEWPNNSHSGAETTVPDLSQDFHTYAIEWSEGLIRWYFDGQQVHQTSDWNSEGEPYPAPFDQRFHLLLNVAVGGNFLPNPPPNPDYFPQIFEIEYVRVYQLNQDAQTPWNGAAPTLPARIEAEHYDLGGDQVAYSDTTTDNIGEAFRNDESVDIEDSNDTDGIYSVGWFTSGEWIEYTVEVPAPGTASFDMRYASNNDGLSAEITLRKPGEVTAAQLAESMPGTDDWYNWENADFGTAELDAGTYILRVTNRGNDFNFNYLDISFQSEAASTIWILH